MVGEVAASTPDVLTHRSGGDLAGVVQQARTVALELDVETVEAPGGTVGLAAVEQTTGQRDARLAVQLDRLLQLQVVEGVAEVIQ